jgi:hypothetical protein
MSLANSPADITFNYKNTGEKEESWQEMKWINH